MSFDWIPGVAVAAVGWIATMWRNAIVTDLKLKVLEEKLAERARAEEKANAGWDSLMKEAMRDLHSVAADVRVMAAEQSVLNKVNTMALSSITDKLAQHDKILSDHASSLILVRQLIGNASKQSFAEAIG